jgi:hypothetical protein
MVTMAGLKVDAIAVYHVQVVTFRLSKHMMGVVQGPVQVHIAHLSAAVVSQVNLVHGIPDDICQSSDRLQAICWDVGKSFQCCSIFQLPLPWTGFLGRVVSPSTA